MMNDEKLREVIDRYEQYLAGLPYPSKQILHLRTMVPKMRSFLEEGRREKLMRWLGFMQGALWMGHHYSLDDLKDHNRPGEVAANLDKR